MATFVALAAFGLGYAMYSQNKNNTRISDIAEGTDIRGYNRYILNQYQTIGDVIYSADLRENNIHSRPDRVTDGIYGITEHHIKFQASDPYTIVSMKRNLNV